MDPPPGYVVSEQVTQVIFSTTGSLLPAGVEGFMFQAAVTDTSSGIFTSTLITITEVSLLNGSLVTCSSSGIMESQTITVAGRSIACVLYTYCKRSLFYVDYRFPHLSIRSNGGFKTKYSQFLSCYSGVGLPLLNWWCVCQLCPHHLPNTSLWVTSHCGDHLCTHHCLLQYSLQCDHQSCQLRWQ